MLAEGLQPQRAFWPQGLTLDTGPRNSFTSRQLPLSLRRQRKRRRTGDLRPAGGSVRHLRRARSGFRVSTSKSVRNLMGSRIWRVGGLGKNPRQYYLCNCFIVDKVGNHEQLDPPRYHGTCARGKCTPCDS
jgi:hypothetical protein